jgi:HEPN domain-containing protein
MSDKKYARQLFVLAEKDLLALTGMVNEKELFHDEIFGFHAQQALEKCLKVLLSFNDIEFRKIHDLNELFNQIKENNIKIPDGIEELKNLNDFAVIFRYDLVFDEEELNRAIIVANLNNLFNYIKEIIKI